MTASVQEHSQSVGELVRAISVSVALVEDGALDNVFTTFLGRQKRFTYPQPRPLSCLFPILSPQR